MQDQRSGSSENPRQPHRQRLRGWPGGDEQHLGDCQQGSPYPDADGDGMPDAWKIANRFDPASDDGTDDADGDGYTNVEEFLNQVDRSSRRATNPGFYGWLPS